jgi:hypothetical protein
MDIESVGDRDFPQTQYTKALKTDSEIVVIRALKRRHVLDLSKQWSRGTLQEDVFGSQCGVLSNVVHAHPNGKVHGYKRSCSDVEWVVNGWSTRCC